MNCHESGWGRSWCLVRRAADGSPRVAVSVARAFQPEHSASAFGCLEIAAAGLGGSFVSREAAKARRGATDVLGLFFSATDEHGLPWIIAGGGGF